MRLPTALALTLVVLVCCTPSTASQPNPVVPPADTGADSGAPSPVATPATVCQHLAQVGCQEGAAPSCQTTINQIIITRVTSLNLTCLMAATTPAAVQHCGGAASCTVPAPAPSASH